MLIKIVVLTQDEHQSEYPAASDHRREFISGFTGSAGTAIITKDQALLSTDGRYFLQAERQLDSNWTLLKQGVPGVPTWREWVVREATKTGCNIGVDPKLISYSEYSALVRDLKQYGLQDLLVPVTPNLVDLVWGEARPARSKSLVTILPVQYSGLSSIEKIKQLRQTIESKRGLGFVVTALDEVAWLFNLRGTDIIYNPVFRSFGYVSATEAVLYVDPDKISKEVGTYLKKNQVTVKPYEAISDDLHTVQTTLLKHNAEATSVELRKRVLSSTDISWELYDALGGEDNVTFIASPVETAKGIKNKVEIAGARECQIRDGAALIRYFAWLENELKNGRTYSDYDAGLKAEHFRSLMDKYKGLSFETISSSGANAAVIHYAPAKDSKFMVDINEVYLCDSGAQYLDGTTDTTRTLHFGTPSEEIIHRYTLVLKGHIAIARTVFPEGTNGYMLDVFARQFLWREGLDYRHGTGHGVGSYLTVHEGPIGIGLRSYYGNASFQAGNILSNEPGYYKDGHYGIRIENVVLVKEADSKSGVPPNEFGKKNFVFETLTRVPLCQKLIEKKILTQDEIDWINDYHQVVYNDTLSFVEHDSLATAWLKRETSPL